MSSYIVTWSCAFEADSYEDAAMQAKGTLTDPGNEAWVVEVISEEDPKIAKVYDVETDEAYFYRAFPVQ